MFISNPAEQFIFKRLCIEATHNVSDSDHNDDRK